jgi:hypothetical protein
MKLNTMFGKPRVPALYDPLRVLSTNQRRRFVEFKGDGAVTADNDGKRSSETFHENKEDLLLY